MGVFSRYAKYYNLLYRDKDYAAEAKYVHELIRAHHSRAKTILNLGCGTGRHDFELNSLGYDVVGVDLSEEMLAAANARLSSTQPRLSNLAFHHGNVQTLELGRTFDAVISLFHVMSYQITNDMVVNAFRTAFQHLVAGGIFIFDFWYGPAVLTDRPSVRVKVLEDDDLSVRRIASPVLHVNDDVVDVNYEVFIVDRKTNMLDTLRETHRMRYFFLPELDFLLKSAGFSIVEDLAWMQVDKRISQDSWYGVLIAKI